MRVRIRLNASLRDYANCKDILEVSGNTVMECLKDLVKRYPSIEQWLFDKKGSLQVLVSINGMEILSKSESLNRGVRDGDELSVFLIFSGG